jgi:hypothetical protein
MKEETRIEMTGGKPIGLRGAMHFGFAIVAGMAVLVLVLSRDSANRAKLESFSETTAVGDQSYFKVPPRAAAPAVAVTFQGKPLTPISVRRIELRDSKMSYAGVDDGGSLRIYTSSEPVPLEKGEAEVKGRPVYFLKSALNEYIRVQ